jgi:hypothetical protein
MRGPQATPRRCTRRLTCAPQRHRLDTARRASVARQCPRPTGRRRRYASFCRATHACPKKVENHIGAITFFICHYNLERGSLTSVALPPRDHADGVRRCALRTHHDCATRLWPSPLWRHGHLAPPSLVKDGRDISTALRPSLSGSVHGLSGSEPRKQIRLWWLDGPHTLDTLEGFIGPEPAAHQLEHPDEVPQAAHLTPVGT